MCAYHAAPMPDWKRYHAAIVAGTSLAEIVNACELAWPWLDLTRDERRAKFADSIRNEASARWMLQALNFVRQRMMRDFGISPGDGARFGALFAAVRAGEGSPDQSAVVGRIRDSSAFDRHRAAQHTQSTRRLTLCGVADL